MKRIYKYGTGDAVPNDALYLYSCVEIVGLMRFVWHYFLVEVDE